MTEILKTYGKGSGHVFNLGHGIDPTIPVENVSAMIEAVQNFNIKNEEATSSYYR
ncbi:uroporphyrinogen decarboxylase family protein [Candidatus Coxiella mudrowiae]|uniref:uroporphyrinogen decarboxylase family protein n=1 Tax=Candidatus Coxiella mudrowiae TaxID=2054173 RepID=UPI00352E22BE